MSMGNRNKSEYIITYSLFVAYTQICNNKTVEYLHQWSIIVYTQLFNCQRVHMFDKNKEEYILYLMSISSFYFEYD